MEPRPALVRSVGRWALTALILNNVIGSGIFGVPSAVAGKVGSWAPLAWLLAAVAVGAIVACFAEVASRFQGSGGPYLYANVAFGRFVGVQMGWLAYLVRVTSAAANFNLLVIYLAELWPPASTPVMGGAVLVAIIGGLAWINYRDVRQGAGASSLLMAIKLVPLVLFALAGLALVASRGIATPTYLADPGARQWLEAGVLLVYTYGGFEAGLIPLGEAKNPQRDAPFALGMTLLGSFLLYMAVQLVVLFALPDAPSHERPLAAAARVLVGPAGATVMALAAILSVYGWGTAAMVSVPRLTYAMAEQGDAPRWLAWVHPRFHTPAASIVTYAVLAFLLAVSGDFLKNLTLAVIARLFTYALVCIALVVLRRRDGHDPAVPPARFRLPAGPAFAAIGLVVALLLVTRVTPRDVVIMAIVFGIATISWLATRRRAPLPVG